MKKLIVALIAVLLLASLLGCQDGKSTFVQDQTLVETAEYKFRNGIPIMNIENVGEVQHPACIATYALGYMGSESWYELGVKPSDVYAENCITWLKKNASRNNELTGWAYSFDSTYNDITIHAPWYSAFGQARGIEALVRWYEKTGDEEALSLAKESAKILFKPICEGGLLYTRDKDIWFEEIPLTDREPSHILNGHMRACMALGLLYDVTEDEELLSWYERGVETLKRWLPLYDTGYWLRYDLNPKKTGLLFRFNEPYGEKLPELAIDEIRLTDPLTGESCSIDVGAAPQDMDPVSGNYLAGLDWQMESLLDGHTVRRLMASKPTSDFGASSAKPNSYFYLNLPSEWTDNLRTDWLELAIAYKDEAPGHVAVEMRSIAPDEEFVELRDGELLLTGSGEWREWKIPVRPSDLGWPVGSVYAEKHLQYLETLATRAPELYSWAVTARSYWNEARVKSDLQSMLQDMKVVEGITGKLPEQTPTMPFYSLDNNGVVRVHLAGDKTQLVNGFWTSENLTPLGKPVYSPFKIAEQATKGGDMFYPPMFDANEYVETDPYWEKYNWVSCHNKDVIDKEPAYRWLRENAVEVGNGLVWHMDADNSYNDLVQKAGWQSAFWQRYIIDAFAAINDETTVKKAAYAYGIPTSEGGLCSVGRDGTLWFEEVPNNSHILNADIASIVALQNVVEKYPDEKIQALYETGLYSLRENLYRFDTGYWTKYDMNPQKAILFGLDWDGGEDSPPIDAIWLYDPDSNCATELDVGSEQDNEGNCYIAGNRWRMETSEDEYTVRAIPPAQAEDETNEFATYFHMTLPEREEKDLFQEPCRYFIIRYKDTTAGILQLQRQSIADGNYLVMLPLRNAIIECIGDGEWKTAVIALRPQDTGWYMGPDYQSYHNEQLGLIAEQTDDWFFYQTLERWNWYLSRQMKEILP